MPTIWNIRSLADPDRIAVLRINAQCQPGVASLDETELLRLMALPNHHLAAGHADGPLAGYALAFDSHAPYDGEEFEFFRAGDGPFIYIDQVATRSGARRAGVGSALYDALEDLARSTDRHLLCCEVNIDPPNPGSMAFHASRGFSEAGVLRTRDGRRVALLIKRLQGNARDATCMEGDRDGGMAGTKPDPMSCANPHTTSSEPVHPLGPSTLWSSGSYENLVNIDHVLRSWRPLHGFGIWN